MARVGRSRLVREQLGLDYEGLSGLPENWVYNTGDEDNPIRRLVSTFLSPLASAYLLVVALIYVLSRPFRWWWGLLAVFLYVALLFTHTRAALAALAFGLVRARASHSAGCAPAVLAVASVVVSGLFVAAYPSIGPSTSYTPEELDWLRANAREEGALEAEAGSRARTPSTESHWQNLRDGVRVVIEHPQGLRARQRRESSPSAPASRSAPASPRTPSSAWTQAWRVSSPSSSGTWQC